MITYAFLALPSELFNLK